MPGGPGASVPGTLAFVCSLVLSVRLWAKITAVVRGSAPPQASSSPRRTPGPRPPHLCFPGCSGSAGPVFGKASTGRGDICLRGNETRQGCGGPRGASRGGASHLLLPYPGRQGPPGGHMLAQVTKDPEDDHAWL